MTFAVHGDATVRQLKVIISQQRGHPIAMQRLVYKGRVLLESHSINSLNLRNGDAFILQVIPNARSHDNAEEVDSSEPLLHRRALDLPLRDLGLVPSALLVFAGLEEDD